MMIKFTLKLLLPFLLLVSSSAFAGLITSDLTEDDYITYNGIDWAWASPINVTPYYSNLLMAPEFHDGWRYATEEELNILRTELTIADFTRTDAFGVTYYVEAVEYWNTELTSVDIDVDDFNSGKINSMLTLNMPTEWDFETFYVRATNANANVPEPTTLFIFAAGLLGFAIRKRSAK